MLQFLLRALLVVFALRILLGLGRFVTGLARGRRDRGPGGPARPQPERELSIDRSSVIDVPFTEEDRQAQREAPLESAVPGDSPGAR